MTGLRRPYGVTRFAALCRLVAGRSVATPGLLAVRFFGVLVAVTLVTGVSLYSGAMGDAMLRATLSRNASNQSLAISDTANPLARVAYQKLDRYIRNQEQRDLGLPLHDLHVHHNTAPVSLYRLGTAAGTIARQPLAELALDYYEGFDDHVRMVTGTLKAPARLPDGSVPVVISAYTARTLHLWMGGHVVYSPDGRTRAARPMMVVGIFVPRDVKSPFWDINAGVPTYRSLVMPRLETFLSFAATSRGSVFAPQYFWLSSIDPAAIHLADANAILDHLERVRSKVALLAPGTTVLTLLDLSLNGFLDQYALLPFILLILVAPIVALVLYGVAVTTALVLDRQTGEIVLFRSRGASVSQIFAIYVLEGLLLGIVALVVGPLAGLPLARLIGHASGFLQFGGGLPIELRPTMPTYLLAGVTALLSLLVGLVAALRLARRSMTTLRREQARLTQRPLWQRLLLDGVLLVAALYGLVVLIGQGPISSGAGASVLARDPVIGIAPLLFAIAITLLISHVVPRMAALGVRLLGHVASPSAHVALQSLARAPRQPMRLVQLCTLTLTLGVFAATVAGVESRNLADQQLYQAGSQVRLEEYDAATKQWTILPLADHRRLPGVRAVTPALRYETFGSLANTTSGGTNVNVLGIDPATAKAVMWFRPDFADQPFERLLQTIALPGPSAIVSDNFLSATGLHQGDQFDVVLSNQRTVHLRVAAVAHYFATLDPHDHPFVVTNLAYLQSASKNPGPSEVWLATARNQAAVDRVLAIAHTWPRRIVDYQGLTPTFSAQNAPLAAGIYGVVSVGFLIAVALSLLGFFAYAYLSLQSRLAEFAIVRVLGLSAGQLRWLLLCEQFFLLGAGVLGGIAAGILTTKLFLPYMPIATNVVPPFQVIMPWLSIGEFVLAVLVVFMLVLSAAVYMLLRLQLGRVLRLGEA